MKLYYTPPHGLMGKSLDALTEAGFETQMVGWGYPPAWVELDEDRGEEQAKNILSNVSRETTFQWYNPNEMSEKAIIDLARNLPYEKLVAICIDLNLPHYETGGVQLAIGLTNRAKERGDLEKLADAVGKAAFD